MTLPTGIYSTILQGFAGYIPDTQKIGLWQQFKTLNGFTSDPPPVSTTEAQFVSFLENYTTTQTPNLSPEEIQRRQSLATVIDIILQLMKSVQQTDVEQNALLLFYTKYAEQYQHMEGNVPIYLGAQSPGFNANLTDPSKFSFGYNNITASDVATFLTQPISSVAANNSFSITTPSTSFFIPNAFTTGNIDWTITFNKPDVNGNATINLYLNPLGGFNQTTPVLNQTYSIVIPPSDTPEQRQAAYAAGILGFMGQHIQQTAQVKTITMTAKQFNGAGSLTGGGSFDFPNDQDILQNHSLLTTTTADPISGQPNYTFVIPIPLPTRDGSGNLTTFLTDLLNAAPTTTYNIPLEKQFTVGWTYSNTAGTVDWPQTSYTSASIPWRYTTENVLGQFNDGSSSAQNENFQKTNAIVQTRATQNQKNQQLIEGIKSKIETIQSNYTGMNNNIQSSNASLKGQMSVITATLHTLKAIMSGIFGTPSG